MRARSLPPTQPSNHQVAPRNRGAGPSVCRMALARRRIDERILDIHGNAASVRVDAHDWIDFLHVARWNDRWVIVHVLWELTPEAKQRMAAGGG